MTNLDLAPVPLAERIWTRWNFASLWIGMAVCVPTYMLASSLIEGGMNWWQATLTILLGNLIVLIPMILNGIPGARYGIPFPVLLRASFGTRGAVFAGLLRALVGCGWFGIQSWIGGSALYHLLLVPMPELQQTPYLGDFIGFNLAEGLCFLAFWGLNIWVIWKGMDLVRRVESWAAPVLLAAGLLLFGWAWMEVGSFQKVLDASKHIQGDSSQGFGTHFWPSLTAIVGFWATLSLNIPDFTRYARSQRAHIEGQTIGLPATMVAFSFIGIFVTSATVLIYGEDIWNPIDLLARFDTLWVVVLSMVILSVATLSTNIAANIVAAANDISNVAPDRIGFRMGGLITGIIGILMCPWKLIADPQGYIFLWLIAYSSLLGAVGGIMIADFFIQRKGVLQTKDLFLECGIYKRWNGAAWWALGISLLPVLPGFFHQVGLFDLSERGHFWVSLYDYAWFITLSISMVVYLGLSNLSKQSSLPELTT